MPTPRLRDTVKKEILPEDIATDEDAASAADVDDRTIMKRAGPASRRGPASQTGEQAAAPQSREVAIPDGRDEDMTLKMDPFELADALNELISDDPPAKGS